MKHGRSAALALAVGVLVVARASASARCPVGSGVTVNQSGDAAKFKHLRPMQGMNCPSAQYVMNKWLRRSFQRSTRVACLSPSTTATSPGTAASGATFSGNATSTTRAPRSPHGQHHQSYVGRVVRRSRELGGRLPALVAAASPRWDTWFVTPEQARATHRGDVVKNVDGELDFGRIGCGERKERAIRLPSKARRVRVAEPTAGTTIGEHELGGAVVNAEDFVVPRRPLG